MKRYLLFCLPLLFVVTMAYTQSTPTRYRYDNRCTRFEMHYDNGVLVKLDKIRGRIDAWYYDKGEFIRIEWR